MAGVTFLLVLAHLGVAAGWLGSMLYSLFVVQPAVARAVPDPARAEDVYRELGAGNRWKVVGLIAAPRGQRARPGHWSGVDTRPPGGSRSAAKVALLVAASALFWWVSWRGWPRRVFALPAEIAGEQARFRRVALALDRAGGGRVRARRRVCRLTLP